MTRNVYRKPATATPSNVVQMFPDKLAFAGHELRGVMIEGEPWFSATDACRCLGLSVYAGASVHLGTLDATERQLVKYSDRLQKPFLGPLFTGSVYQLTIISRPGLFKLIQRSNKPEARQFDRWVRHEVLPQIMDHGGYVMPDADPGAVAEAMVTNKSRGDLDILKQMVDAMQAARDG